MMQALLSLDGAILLFVQEHVRCAALNGIMVFITKLGNAGLLWLCLGALFLIFKKTRKAGISVLLCVAIAWLVNQGLKELVARPRPFTVIEDLTILISTPHSWSFPSGHSCSSLAAAYAICRSFKHGWLAYIPAALIALSRIYVGVHYTSDVLAGAIVGTVMAAIVFAALAAIFKKVREKRRAK